ENVRLACQQASQLMVDRHNSGNDPRFFFDPACWKGKSMIPFSWNGYWITGSLEKSWNNVLPNKITVRAEKGSYGAEQLLQVQQRRAEDFALYTDAALEMNASPLFDGQAFLREGIDLSLPDVVFREFVQGEIRPESNASVERVSLKSYSYP